MPVREPHRSPGIAKDLGISESCLRNWMAQADADEERRPPLTSAEKKELAELRRKNRLLEQENEILRRVAAISRGGMFFQNSFPAGP